MQNIIDSNNSGLSQNHKAIEGKPQNFSMLNYIHISYFIIKNWFATTAPLQFWKIYSNDLEQIYWARIGLEFRQLSYLVNKAEAYVLFLLENRKKIRILL